MHHITEPIIILGAARSGTKMLRDTLAAAHDLRVVEYDVNYVWRVGNERFPHDGLPADLVTPKVHKFIRRQLPRIAVGSKDASRFVEKTVGNVLRVPFIHRIYPSAKYVFLIRDGRDVAESAARCWHEPAELGYLAAKLKTFPWLHGLSYAARYASQFAMRKANLIPHLQSWGPRYQDIDDHVRQFPLWKVCALQWVACVEAYERSKQFLATNQVIEVRYEDIVRDPASSIRSICQQLEIDDHRSVTARAQKTIVGSNIGKRSQLSEFQLSVIQELQSGVLERWGYRRALANHSSRNSAA